MKYLYNIGIAHAEQILILAFLAITFLQSGFDKLFNWKENLAFLNEHFAKTFLKNNVSLFLRVLTFFEILVGILNVLGIFQIYISQKTFIGFIAVVLTAKVLLALLFGQRIAKDYEGAKTVAVYFVIAVLGVFFLK